MSGRFPANLLGDQAVSVVADRLDLSKVACTYMH
jgi:hypothetical protein